MAAPGKPPGRKYGGLVVAPSCQSIASLRSRQAQCATSWQPEVIVPLVKLLHVSLAYITVVGFIARGALALVDSPLRSARWIRISPHVIDTLLLICGVVLAVQLSLSPSAQPWLAAKIIALFAYIGFGVMAMRAKRPALRLVGFVAALIAVGYIFAVAYSKQVIPV